MTLKRISPQEAKDLLDNDGAAYLDVRSIPEFDGGHPAGAYNIPLMHMGPSGMQPNPEFLSMVEASFTKDAKLVIGCKSGGRSKRAAETLIAAGFTGVVDQRAGFEGSRGTFGGVEEPGWKPAGLAVAMKAEPGRSFEELSTAAKAE